MSTRFSFALGAYITRALPHARYADASELVDRIKAIKSSEEMALVRRAALMQDGAMKTAFDAVRPGMRDRDVAAIAQCYSQRNGSENGIYLCASMPLGSPTRYWPAAYAESRHREGRRSGAPGGGTRGRVACMPSSAASA